MALCAQARVKHAAELQIQAKIFKTDMADKQAALDGGREQHLATCAELTLLQQTLQEVQAAKGDAAKVSICSSRLLASSSASHAHAARCVRSACLYTQTSSVAC